jgi:hypothetical protein
MSAKTLARKVTDAATVALKDAAREAVKAEAANMAEATPRPPMKKALSPERIGKSSSVANTWGATIPDSVPYERWLEGDFWKHLARKAHIGDDINCRNDAYTLRALLTIVAVEPHIDRIEVRELWHKELQPAAMESKSLNGFRAEYLGLQDGFGVIRENDGTLMIKNLPSRRECEYRIISDYAIRPVA